MRASGSVCRPLPVPVLQAYDCPGLITTATLENEIVKYRSAVSSARTSATAPRSGLDAVKRIEALEADLRALSPNDNEEAVQKHACLLWARWAASEVVKEPPDNELYSPLLPEQGSNISSWSKICTVKAAFVRGTLLARIDRRQDAEAAYKSVLPFLDANRSAIASTQQLSYWSEQLLAALAISKVQDDEKLPASQGDNVASLAFRHWDQLATTGSETVHFAYGHPGPHRSRASVWNSWYAYMSNSLQHNHYSRSIEFGSPSEQIALFRRVQTAYENEFLQNTRFPKATESNHLVEEWVEQVIRNWTVLCGPQWTDEDLGQGGRNSFSRSVIDILYRAAMKTFHSTLILRRLFQVHKALADFELAYKALDTYVELSERGRARAQKSGHAAAGQDSDEIVLRTIAEGIEGLCAFGRQVEAKQAYDLCLKLGLLLDAVDPYVAMNVEVSQVNGHHDSGVDAVTLSLESQDIILRALSIGKAHWAISTPFNEKRSLLQNEALGHLTKAAGLSLASYQKTQTLYALGLLLAQMRDVDGALESVKLALAPDADSENAHTRQRAVPIWHLLSLLLSARQDYDTALHSCVASLEQVPSSQGHPETRSSEANDDVSEKRSSDDMFGDLECCQLQELLEVRMTELALADLSEGPEHAVNSSNDLLALYFRLFGRLQLGTEARPVTNRPEPPNSSAGTVKSLRGSLFGRKKNASSVYVQKPQDNSITAPSIRSTPTRPTTQATQAPTIQVTDENAKAPPHKHRIFRHSSDPKRLSQPSQHAPNDGSGGPMSRGLCQPPSSSGISTRRQSFETAADRPPSSTGTAETALPLQPPLSTIVSADESSMHRSDTRTQNLQPVQPMSSANHNSSPEAKQPTPSIPHQLSSHSEIPPPTGHDDDPPKQDVRLLNSSTSTGATVPPITRFSHTTSQKHALAILVNIWLTIASLYRRAALFDDSKDATDEAAKAATRIEAIVAEQDSSARAFADPGWGSGGKSSDEVWADVYCERAELLLAVASMKQEKGLVDGVSSEEAIERRKHIANGAASVVEVDNASIREAVEQFETCLTFFPNHCDGIIGLSNVLLDYCERKVELGRKVDDSRPKDKTILPTNPIIKKDDIERRRDSTLRPTFATGTTSTSLEIPNGISSYANTSHTSLDRPSSSAGAAGAGSGQTDDDLRKTPENLNRLAARDRAYGLLSTLTKLGSGWDNSDAWYALARAHELGGELEKAKEILWWVVKLEDTRPLRPWGVVNSKGYVL